MAGAKSPPKGPKVKLLERFKPGKMSGWLPAIALFLCLAMFAIAALVLVQVGADPESPPSPVVTSVSAQGFQGLRRLLDADGHFTVINRYEDDGPAEHGDLEIITLDDAYSVFTMNESPSYDDDEDSASAAESSAGEGASSSVDEVVAAALKAQADYGNVPDQRRVNHLLYRPLGKAVLIVVPKWDSHWWPKNPRWAQAPTLTDVKELDRLLTILSPVSEKPTTYGADGRPIPIESVAGKKVDIGAEKTITFDDVDYGITRAARPAKPKAQVANPNHDPMIEFQNRPDPDEPIAADIVLTPAPGQSLFHAPIRAGRIAGLQSITAPNLVPVLVTADGRPVLSRLIVTEGRPQTKVPVYVLSDPDLLNNQILAQPQKVVNALALVDGLTPQTKGKSRVIFNMTFNGLSFDHDLLHALSRPPFVAIPLAMLILGLALMWAAFARFGPAQEAPAGPPLGRGVRTLADNAARLMAITLKEARLGPAYATLVRDMVIRGRGHMQVDPSQSLDDLAERIGKTHGATDSYLNLKDKAGRVATVHQLIDVTLKLHAWKTEIERAHI